jgi:hypothetical protein
MLLRATFNNFGFRVVSLEGNASLKKNALSTQCNKAINGRGRTVPASLFENGTGIGLTPGRNFHHFTRLSSLLNGSAAEIASVRLNPGNDMPDMLDRASSQREEAGNPLTSDSIINAEIGRSAPSVTAGTLAFRTSGSGKPFQWAHNLETKELDA